IRAFCGGFVHGEPGGSLLPPVRVWGAFRGSCRPTRLATERGVAHCQSNADASYWIRSYTAFVSRVGFPSASKFLYVLLIVLPSSEMTFVMIWSTLPAFLFTISVVRLSIFFTDVVSALGWPTTGSSLPSNIVV